MFFLRFFTVTLTALLAALLVPRPASACGGLFCNSSNPVNQEAERIIFADDGEGTVTAIIEIQYAGPASEFSWVLPVPGVPDVEVSSVQALDRLQSLTNPQYNLNPIFEDDCGFRGGVAQSAGAPTAGFANDAAGEGAPAVIVLDSGTVGPFNYDVISLNPALAEPADAAIDWLNANGYDVTALGPERLGPYLEDGLNLIAFKLTNTATSGSIRPIRISYDSTLPFIPIRPTAVAAADDMGILVWVLGGVRAIPKNYKHLELNEARINWFNATSTYDDVVIAAADEAGGQGFVTEMASASDVLDDQVVFQWERDEWMRISSTTYADAYELLNSLYAFNQWDGFADAVAAAVTLPDTISLSDFTNCLGCYRDQVVFDQQTLLTEVYEKVVKPMFDTQTLLSDSGYFTRFYTTMSADEMTVDPSFDFNPDLADVSNIHTADQYLRCDSDEWRVELPQGGVVYGTEAGVWPVDVEEQPAALKILQLGTEGQGDMVEDNTAKVLDLLSSGGPQPDPDLSVNPGGGGSSATGTAGSDATDPAAGGSSAETGIDDEGGGHNACGCRVPGTGAGHPLGGLLLTGLGLVGLLRRRRRGG